MKTTFVGRAALIYGPRFDHSRVVAAHEELVDALSDKFGPSLLTTNQPKAQRTFGWPVPAKALARKTWGLMKDELDVVDEPLIHLFEGLTIKAYLLGKTWCVMDPVTRTVTAPEGRGLSSLDPSPTVCVYGPRADGGACALVPKAAMDAVSRLLASTLRHLDLGFVRYRVNDPVTSATGVSDYGYIVFPHRAYGDGFDWNRVRCVYPDGGEIDPDCDAN